MSHQCTRRTIYTNVIVSPGQYLENQCGLNHSIYHRHFLKHFSSSGTSGTGRAVLLPLAEERIDGLAVEGGVEVVQLPHVNGVVEARPPAVAVQEHPDSQQLLHFAAQGDEAAALVGEEASVLKGQRPVAPGRREAHVALPAAALAGDAKEPRDLVLHLHLVVISKGTFSV